MAKKIKNFDTSVPKNSKLKQILRCSFLEVILSKDISRNQGYNLFSQKAKQLNVSFKKYFEKWLLAIVFFLAYKYNFIHNDFLFLVLFRVIDAFFRNDLGYNKLQGDSN